MADKSAVPIVRVRDTHHAMESQLDPSCFSQNDSGEVKATFAPDSVVCVRVDSQTLGVCKIMSTVKLSMLSSMSDSCGYEESSDKDWSCIDMQSQLELTRDERIDHIQ